MAASSSSLPCATATKAPAPINQTDKNGVHFIDKLRGLSWVYNENAPVLSSVSPRSFYAPQPKKKSKVSRIRLDKRNRKALHKLKKAVKRQCLWDESTWEHANKLDPHERIRLLRQAVNAPLLTVTHSSQRMVDETAKNLPRHRDKIGLG